MLEIIDLKKRYKEIEAVRGINLFLEKGESVGLLGPNGAGKSTAIGMISSLIKPTSGDVRLLGDSVVKHPQDFRKILGIVPQEIALYPQLTARENLLFFGKMYKLSRQRLIERVDEVLQLVGLRERQHDRVKTFSGGMKRRLNIAAALIHQPSILIMDEPTVGIDPQSRHNILETVKGLQREQGMTILYTSHYMEEVEYLCDRVYIMDRGLVIAAGTKDEVKSILTSEETIELSLSVEKGEFLERVKSHQLVASIHLENGTYTIISRNKDEILPYLFNEARHVGAEVVGFKLKTPTLEDVFLHLTGRTLRD